ncbi:MULTISPECIES: DNA N-6-adenine-methyltransferase [Klebsiella]|uniref:DNA N-6-adenine-methyltransferase n=1 Tax=Klebsiella TaxID=570 RepID=UPI001CCE92EE|nr:MULTISPECIES: DNA N-6-adenine-methyltransferase [Klebsiella]MDM4406377.1 DNA N-6-adenine-methyltransferase [Klebsiella grimontii]MDV0391527.1 DNA N-6-adenine-methyltransferase [Klebsiella grimontii]MDV0408802.1 DNA N-6-adenine-methyltransferase [Klebsiella grimontii]
MGKDRGGNDNWESPWSLFRGLNKEFSFTLDAAANADNALCLRFWTEVEDALKQDWYAESSIWCNPPYSLIPSFIEHAHKAVVTCFLILVRTQAKWWLRLILMNPNTHEIRFLSRNVRFKAAPGTKQKRLKNRAPMAYCVVIFRNVPHKCEIRQTVHCADTGLLLHVINRGSVPGRPTIYDAEVLDQIIDLYERKRATPKEISERIKIPLQTVKRVVQRLT